MNRQFIEGDMSQPVEQDNAGITFQLVEGNALYEEDLVGLLNQTHGGAAGEFAMWLRRGT